MTLGFIKAPPSAFFCKFSLDPQNYVKRLIVTKRALSLTNPGRESIKAALNCFLGVFLS